MAKLLKLYINKLNRLLINILRYLALKTSKIVDYNFEIKNSKIFEEYISKNIYIDKYSNLIKNLDFKSINVVNVNLERVLNFKKIIFANKLSENELLDYLDLKEYKFLNQKNYNVGINFYKKLFPGFNNYEIPVFKFHHGLILLDKIAKEYLINKDCIDAGSHTLDSAVMFSTYYNFNSIYSFELDKKNYLQGLGIVNSKYSHLKNIISINEGIWRENLNIPIINSGTNFSSIDKKSKNKKLSKVVKLDSFCTKNNLNLGFIKMDIEGAEYDALIGTKETIKKFLPIMSISIYHNPKDFFEIKPLIETFAPDQYDFYIRKLAPWYNQLETSLICIPKKLNSKLLDYYPDEIYG